MKTHILFATIIIATVFFTQKTIAQPCFEKTYGGEVFPDMYLNKDKGIEIIQLDSSYLISVSIFNIDNHCDEGPSLIEIDFNGNILSEQYYCEHSVVKSGGMYPKILSSFTRLFMRTCF